jgi:arylsulfatase A-like enzyme
MRLVPVWTMRLFTRHMILVWLFLSLGVVCCTSKQEKPNFIFILIDDLGKEWISCYGSVSVSTPNIDRIAGEGILFHNVWSMPQCTPSRVALLTGQYPHTNGWIDHYDVPRWGHGASFDASMNPCFPKILKAGGYRTCAAGKWQVNDFRLEPDAMVKAGFDEYCMWTGGEGGNETISDNRYWDPYIHTRDGSHTCKGAFGPDIFCDFIRGFMEENRDHPMFIYYPMVLTHVPFVHTPEEPDAHTNFEKHRAMVRYTDLIIGRILSSLEELGIRDHTYLFITTDNGTVPSMIGEINGVFIRGGKAYLTENGINAPFIVLCPGLAGGIESDALVDFTDIYPTLLELAGIDISPEDPIEGCSFASILKGEGGMGRREWILSMGGHPATIGQDGRVENYFSFRDRVVRDERYKVYIDTLRQICRIYDLEADPYETENLMGNGPWILPVLEKFTPVMKDQPNQDRNPLFSRLTGSYYDIPADELNQLSKRVHSRHTNMQPLASQDEYIHLKE